MSQTLTDTDIRRLADLPSPKGLPLIGNLLQLAPERLHLTLEQWARELGPMYTLDLGTKRALVCSDPELLQTVLRDRPEGYRRYSPIESVIAEQHANGAADHCALASAHRLSQYRTCSRTDAAAEQGSNVVGMYGGAQCSQNDNAAGCQRGETLAGSRGARGKFQHGRWVGLSPYRQTWRLVTL